MTTSNPILSSPSFRALSDHLNTILRLRALLTNPPADVDPASFVQDVLDPAADAARDIARLIEASPEFEREITIVICGGDERYRPAMIEAGIFADEERTVQ